MAPTPSRKRKEQPEVAAPPAPAPSLTSPAQKKVTKQERQARRDRARLAMERLEQQSATRANAVVAAAPVSEETFVSPTKRRRTSLTKSEAIAPPPSAAAAAPEPVWAPPTGASLSKQEQRRISRLKALRSSEKSEAQKAALNSPTADFQAPAAAASQLPPARISPPAAMAAVSSFLSPPSATHRLSPQYHPSVSSPSISESEGSISPPRNTSTSTVNETAPLYYNPPRVADFRANENERHSNPDPQLFPTESEYAQQQLQQLIQDPRFADSRLHPDVHANEPYSHQQLLQSESVHERPSLWSQSPPVPGVRTYGVNGSQRNSYPQSPSQYVPPSQQTHSPAVPCVRTQALLSTNTNATERYSQAQPQSVSTKSNYAPRQQQPASAAPSLSTSSNRTPLPGTPPSVRNRWSHNNTNVVMPPVMNDRPFKNHQPVEQTNNATATNYTQTPTATPPVPTHSAAFQRTRLGSPIQYENGSSQAAQFSPVLRRMQEQVERYSTATDVDSLAHDLNLVGQEEPLQESAPRTPDISRLSDKTPPKKPSLLSSPNILSILVGVCAVGLIYITDVRFDLVTPISTWIENITSAALPPTATPACFADSEDALEGPIDASVCTQPAVPCPFDGICQYGLLQNCMHRHREVAPTTDACILTKEANDTLLAAEKLLVTWTVQHSCSAEGCPYVVPVDANEFATARPWFHFSQLMGELDHEWDLDLFHQAPDKFSIHRDGNLLLIGLSEKLLDNSLPVPLWCTIQKWIAGCLRMFVHSIISLFQYVVFGSLTLLATYPIKSLSALSFSSAVAYIVRLRSEEGRLRSQVAKVRRMAYQRLQDAAPEIVSVLHVRDDIAWELYPNGGEEQRYLKTKVWARVFKDLEQDNRVGKETRVVNRKQERTWQWLAVTPKSR